MKYKQLAAEERFLIAAMRHREVSLAGIARFLGRHRSTIGREVNRNRSGYDGGYRSARAHEKTQARRGLSRRNMQFGKAEIGWVEALIRERWSPEQISGYLKKCGELRISHETIYRHIWRDKKRGGTLHTNLRWGQKQRYKRYRSRDSRGRLAGKRHITERAACVEDRSRIGDWEIDTVHGAGRESIVTLVERRTGYLLVGKVSALTVEETNRATIELMGRYPGWFKTITSDNGTEFHGYAEIEKATGVMFYFATPHHSWERGTNENTNGLIRQYLPKRTSMANLDQEDCDQIAETLNQRPRKRHGFNTPNQAFLKNAPCCTSKLKTGFWRGLQTGAEEMIFFLKFRISIVL